jgi:hypothetical protein
MMGRRVRANEQGYLRDLRHDGDYGRVERTLEQVHGIERQLWWQLIAPDGSQCCLDPSVHTITEHQDGTISVLPSIVTDSWHGWLSHGLWTSV